jgi:hypothetical protein
MRPAYGHAVSGTEIVADSVLAVRGLYAYLGERESVRRLELDIAEPPRIAETQFAC